MRSSTPVMIGPLIPDTAADLWWIRMVCSRFITSWGGGGRGEGDSARYVNGHIKACSLQTHSRTYIELKSNNLQLRPKAKGIPYK